MTAVCPACTVEPLEAVRAPVPEPGGVILSLPGVHCAACIARVEDALNGMAGVREARVNLSLKRARIETNLDPQALVERLAEVGYDAYPLNEAALGAREDGAARAMLLRVGLSGFALMNVMLLSVAIWSGASDATRDFFHMISAAIALPAIAYAGQPFFASAWAALKGRGLNMDVPISLAIGLASGMSLFETFNGGRDAYFDAALSLTFFLLIGRYLDMRTRGAARSAARELAALEVHSAIRLTEAGQETVDVAELAVGDRILVPAGAQIAVDGVLLSDCAMTDRSFLTGESRPVESGKGAALSAGEINLGAPLALRATAVRGDTTLARVAELVERAENARNRYTALADRAARIYAPSVHLLSAAAFLGWLAWDGDLRHALNIAIAVLIITCPCALGLAVPAVSTAAVGRLYRMGFLVKSGTALERLAEVDTVVFDKTGTLTRPGPVAPLMNLSFEPASVALALARHSDHPVSRALAGMLADIAPAEVTGIDEVKGCGVSGTWNGHMVRLGRGSWIGADFEGPGLRIGEETWPLDLGETLREGAKAAVDGIGRLGLGARILSGDRAGAVDAVAAELDLPAQSGIDAEAKHAVLSALAAEGHRVAMVGDGLNDTAALAAAHASVAPASALDAARSAADVVILRDHLDDLPMLIRVARAASRLSRQNFAIAALYNLVAVPIALLGFASPLVAALAMSASSLTVLLNALRIRVMK